jgi:DNA-3-methyladenine glycosylase II
MPNHRPAVSHLKRADPVMAAIIARVGPCRLAADAGGTHFQALARSIIYQQLSGKAAGTIHDRFRALFPDGQPDPAALLPMADDVLRGVGLSRQKTASLRDLAARVTDGTLPLGDVEALDDDALVQHLVQVRGVGRWTAQMFMMFRLGRADVLPDGDLGIQNAVQRAYRLRARPTPARVVTIGRPWRPYATVASWYLWRSLDAGDSG